MGGRKGGRQEILVLLSGNVGSPSLLHSVWRHQGRCWRCDTPGVDCSKGKCPAALVTETEDKDKCTTSISLIIFIIMHIEFCFKVIESSRLRYTICVLLSLYPISLSYGIQTTVFCQI